MGLAPPFTQHAAVQVHQGSQGLLVWFAVGHDIPRRHWNQIDLPSVGMRVWLNQRQELAGLAIAKEVLPEADPYRRLIVTAEDFK